MKLDGRTAVITGAASGMGRGLALLLARKRCPVAIFDVDETGLAETQKLIGDAVPVFARRLDVADREAQIVTAQEVREWSPAQLGAVFNNAGVTLSQTIEDVTDEDFRWIVDINFWGVVHGTKAYLPWLLEQNSGVVVNTSSIFGIVAWPTQGTYNATKFAVRGFTEALRHELRGSGVKAVTVHPGGVATSIVRNARFYTDDLGRGSKDELESDFAQAARLSSDEAAAIIVRGVERGRERVLVGSDARAVDLLQRLVPERYFDVVKRLEPYLVKRGRAEASPTASVPQPSPPRAD